MTAVPAVGAYREAFARERARAYPTIDAFEHRLGFALGRDQLEAAARVLACPVKAHAPNWQHGRVLYALARVALSPSLASIAAAPVTLLDIGTAKGFSALCLEWARLDARAAGRVVSVDVIDPRAEVARNSIADCDGPSSLAALLAPWPEAGAIEFRQATGIDWLTSTGGRLRLAFVDGKHSQEVVTREGLLLADRQRPGDLVLFDDVQLFPVIAALLNLERAGVYALEILRASPDRGYAIATRR